MQDLVSIIIPVYNTEEHLSRCVDSLLAQTYPNIQIVLVDDCSSDNSPAIAGAYAEKYPEKCSFVQREKNGRASAARNSGMEVAKGEWLLFVDSDDWVAPDYVETLYQTAQVDNADIVMSKIYYYYSESNCIEVDPFAGLVTESTHKEKVALSRPYITTRLFNRKLFRENNLIFQEDIWRAEEMPTAISLLTATDKISIVNKPMYYYFQRSTSISNQNQKGVDVSFYPKTVSRMIELAKPGFDKEMEFRAVTELLYGMPMIMIRSGKTKAELSEHVDWFNKKFPEWKNNEYLPRLEKGKYIFIRCVANKQYWLLKMLIWAWDVKLMIKG